MAVLVKRQLPIIFVVSVALLAVASSASAATTSPFGCRASGLRIVLGGGSPVEPIVANANTTPCHSSNAGVGSVNVPNSGSTATGSTTGGSSGTGTTSSNATAGPVGAFTYETGSTTGSTAPGATAVASVQGLTIPTANGLITVAGPIQAEAQYACESGQVVGSAQSTLDVVYVNGHPTQLPAAGDSTTIMLGGSAYISVNEKVNAGTGVEEERALDIHLGNGSEIVVGEAEVTMPTNETGTQICGNNPNPPVLELCPDGSTINVVAQFCEITYEGQTIIVSRPFQGPSGGTVVALGAARKKYHSRCLYTPGPKYAVIATKQHAHVIGTHLADRILGLAKYQKIAGLGGNDCIDDSAGRSIVFDGRGNDTIIVGPGGNRVAVGNGKDLIIGGSGRDIITAGNGPDTIYGNGGNDKINSGLGKDRDYGGPGNDRIYSVSSTARVNGGPGHNVCFVRGAGIAYAKAHGCQVVHHIQ